MNDHISYWSTIRKHATDRQKEYIDSSHLNSPPISQSAAADMLGIDRRAVDRGIQSAINKATEAGAVLDVASGLKILSIDIETAPMVGYLWSLWSEVRSTDFIERDWYITSYAYKWLGNDEVHGRTLFECSKYGPYEAGKEDDRELVEDLWSLFDEADIVVAHNGDKFDIKKIKTRLVEHMFLPPAPFRTVDTLKICKREFGFTSNRLDHIAETLLGEGKMENSGISLWIGCIKGDPESWHTMLEYNKKDVDILERVYLRIRAWDRSHPNVAVMLGIEESACTVCASTSLTPLAQSTATNVSVFQTYRCDDCGHVMRGRSNTRSKEEMKVSLVNAR